MKKTYTKPTLYAERFELLEHISSCKVGGNSVNVTYRDGNSCTYTDANLTLFYEGGVCDGGADGVWDPAMYNNYQDFLASLGRDDSGCYNAFSDGNFFAS